jgi:PAS domain S-box-containing protein
MSAPLRCLLVEDSEDDAILLLRCLRDGGYDLTSERVDTPEAMSAALDRQPWDIVISDFKMPSFSGMAALELLKASGRDLPFIIVSGTIGEDLAVAAMKAGAHDYLMKGKLARLVPVVQRELREAAERRERKHAEGWARLTSAALTAAANAILITDRDGSIEWVNPAFSALTGYSLTEAVGKNPRDLVNSGKHDRDVFQNLWETILAGRVWRGELVNRRKDGTLYPEEQTITPVLGANGEVAHFVAIKWDLTERNLASEMVRASREQLQAVFEQAAVGMVIADGIESRFLNVNHCFCAMLGYTRDELLNLDPGDITHPDDRAADNDQMQQLSFGIVRDFTREKRYRRKDGTFMWGKAFVAPLNPSEAKSTRQIVVVEDISARKQAEEALQQEQTLLSSLISTIPDNIYFKDRQSRFVRISEAMAKGFGLRNAAEAVGKTDSDFFMEEHARQAFADEQRIMQTGEPLIGVEEKETWPDGHISWASTTKMPLRDAQGGITGIVGISRDITKRKAADRLIHEQSEILSKSHEGVMIVNLANQVTFWNHAAEEAFGWTAAEALIRPPEQLLGIDDLGVVSTLHAAVERDGFWNGELRGQARDGRKIIIDCRTTLIRNEAGQPVARLNTLADITEKKLLEEKYLHAQRLESLGMLAAGIAHDLNNVLAPILFAAPLLRKSVSSPRDLKILDTLERSGERGTGLVKLILGFAQSASGEPRLTQLKHIARDVISLVEETFPKSIRLEHNIPADTWPILCNPTQIHQVLLNLCVNARDAMPQGGTLRIAATNRRLDAEEAGRIPGARPGAWLTLEVADTGTGIPPEVVQHIWEPFFTTKGTGKGTGLGLSTVRGIVVTHHGFIELQTEVGHGTTFRVFLPAVESDIVAAASVHPFAIPEGHGELVLVVDDDKAVRDVVTAMLRRHNYRVLCCNDGVEALELFTANLNEFVLVITDVDMPKLGGAGLIRTLMKLRPDLRVLFISGLAQSAVESSDMTAAEKLAHAFLQKPFKFEELLGAVDRLLHPPKQD